MAKPHATPIDFNCGICSAKLTDASSLFTSCGHFFCNNRKCTRLREGSTGRECDTCGEICTVGTLANKAARYEGDDVQRFVFIPVADQVDQVTRTWSCIAKTFKDQVDEVSRAMTSISEAVKFRDSHFRILRQNNETTKEKNGTLKEKNAALKQEVYKNVQELEQYRKEVELVRHENAQLRKQLRVVSRHRSANPTSAAPSANPKSAAPSDYVESDERSMPQGVVSPPPPRRAQNLQPSNPARTRRQHSPPRNTRNIVAPVKVKTGGTGGKKTSIHRSKSLNLNNLNVPYGGNARANGLTQLQSYGFGRGANASVTPSRSLHAGTRKSYGFNRPLNANGQSGPPPSYSTAALGRSNFSRKYAGDSHATRATGGTRVTGVTGGTRATGGTRVTGVTGGSRVTGGTRATGGTRVTGGTRATGGTREIGGTRATGGTRANAGARPTGGTLLRRSNGVGGATSRLPAVGGVDKRGKRGEDRVERRRTKGVEQKGTTPFYRQSSRGPGNAPKLESSRALPSAATGLSSRAFGSGVLTKDLRVVPKPSATPAMMMGTRRKKHSLFGRYE